MRHKYQYHLTKIHTNLANIVSLVNHENCTTTSTAAAAATTTTTTTNTIIS